MHICHQWEISTEHFKHFLEAVLLLTSEHAAKQGFVTNYLCIAGYHFTAEIRQGQNYCESMPRKITKLYSAILNQSCGFFNYDLLNRISDEQAESSPWWQAQTKM